MAPYQAEIRPVKESLCSHEIFITVRTRWWYTLVYGILRPCDHYPKHSKYGYDQLYRWECIGVVLMPLYMPMPGLQMDPWAHHPSIPSLVYEGDEDWTRSNKTSFTEYPTREFNTNFQSNKRLSFKSLGIPVYRIQRRLSQPLNPQILSITTQTTQAMMQSIHTHWSKSQNFQELCSESRDTLEPGLNMKHLNDD